MFTIAAPTCASSYHSRVCCRLASRALRGEGLSICWQGPAPSREGLRRRVGVSGKASKRPESRSLVSGGRRLGSPMRPSSFMRGCTQGARKPRSSPHTSMLVARISTGSVLRACSRHRSSCAAHTFSCPLSAGTALAWSARPVCAHAVCVGWACAGSAGLLGRQMKGTDGLPCASHLGCTGCAIHLTRLQVVIMQVLEVAFPVRIQ